MALICTKSFWKFNPSPISSIQLVDGFDGSYAENTRQTSSCIQWHEHVKFGIGQTPCYYGQSVHRLISVVEDPSTYNAILNWTWIHQMKI